MQGEVVEDPLLDPQSQTPLNIPNFDNRQEEIEIEEECEGLQCLYMKLMREKKEGLKRRRWKLKKDHAKVKVNNEIRLIKTKIEGERPSPTQDLLL